jgi:hypothetical protein
MYPINSFIHCCSNTPCIILLLNYKFISYENSQTFKRLLVRHYNFEIILTVDKINLLLPLWLLRNTHDTALSFELHRYSFRIFGLRPTLARIASMNPDGGMAVCLL